MKDIRKLMKNLLWLFVRNLFFSLMSPTLFLRNIYKKFKTSYQIHALFWSMENCLVGMVTDY